MASYLAWEVGTAAKQKTASRAPWSQWWPQKPLTILSCRSSFDVGIVCARSDLTGRILHSNGYAAVG